MRYLFILLASISMISVQAQVKEITISAQGRSIATTLESEDASLVLAINSSSPKTGKLKIVNSNWQKEKEWKRSFSIYNSQDASVADVKACKARGVYEVSLAALLAKMPKGETYKLYTMAIPRDPKKAAVVRVRRVLICSITIN